MKWRRVIWTLVGLTAVYVLMLTLTTPTPSKDDRGLFDRIPGSWFAGPNRG